MAKHLGGSVAPKGEAFAALLSASRSLPDPKLRLSSSLRAKTPPPLPPSPHPPSGDPASAADPKRVGTLAADDTKEKMPKAASEPSLELDPAARVAFQLAPPQHAAPLPRTVAPPTDSSAHAARTAETHALAASLVERAAFWGDGARGVARLHFGTRARGGLAGATVMLESIDGEVSVKVSGASDSDAVERLAARLRGKGIAVSND